MAERIVREKRERERADGPFYSFFPFLFGEKKEKKEKRERGGGDGVKRQSAKQDKYMYGG